jgi:hypothetical protein
MKRATGDGVSKFSNDLPMGVFRGALRAALNAA